MLVGAGPGDPGLITVKGQTALRECDVVVYDNLVPDELIVSLPPTVELRYVGKKAGSHSLPQDKINQLLVDLSSEGKKIVRLKGGDPFVFGRGGEEARFLKDHGVEYEIVPGITAGVAGTAYAGIPCTDRTKASSVTFVTGHKASEKEQTSVSWDWMGRMTDGTLVVYMGVGEVENIVKQLIDGGMSPETPAAVLERATLPTQRMVVAPLISLSQRIKAENIQPPALLVIGKVVDLQSLVGWFENKPLFGLRVMVTRPADQATELYESLRSLGVELIPYPTIASREYVDHDGWELITNDDVLGEAGRWLVFTSENGVRYFMNQVVERIGDIRWLGGFEIAAIGTGTARALKRFSLTPDFMPTVATVAELADQMCRELDVADDAVIRVQGNLSDDTVTRVLSRAGAMVTPLTVYETYTPTWPEGFKEKLVASPPDVIMFSSGSTANGLCEHLTPEEIETVTGGAVVLSIGPMTTQVVQSRGINVTLEARTHSVPAMVEQLIEYYAKNPIGGRR